MNSEMQMSVKINVGLIFVGDEHTLITVHGDIDIEDIAGILHQLAAESKGWA